MLQLGSAECDITPEIGSDLCGFYARTNPSTGLLDRLYARSNFLQGNRSRYLLTSLDLLGISRTFHKRLTTRIAGQTRIPASNISTAATHTHSGPATIKLIHCGKRNSAYVENLEQALAQIATASATNTQEVEIRVGQIDAPLSVNRRDEKQPVDSTLTTVSFHCPKSGEVKGLWVNYACHPVVLGGQNTEISGDYAGRLQSNLSAHYKTPVLFLNGACGDINPITANKSNPALLETMAAKLTQLAIKSVAKAKPYESHTDVSVLERQIDLPTRKFASSRHLEARYEETIAKFEIPNDLFAKRFEKNIQAVRGGMYPSKTTLRLQAVALGPDLALVFVPAEIFNTTGVEIKDASPYKTTLVVGFANGLVGYIPPRQAMLKGGYEADLAHHYYDYPELDSAAEEVLLAAVNKLTADLYA